MENTLKNIQTVTFCFFFTLGLGYLLSSLLVLNSNFLPLSGTVKQMLFLPFIIMGIGYASSSVLQGLASEGKNSRIQTVIVMGCAIILATLITLVHFGFPAK